MKLFDKKSKHLLISEFNDMSSDQKQLFLMANLGSEVLRALSLHRSGKEAEYQRAFMRALKILHDAQEIQVSVAGNDELRLLEATLKDIQLQEQSVEDQKLWESYFNPFALRMMNTVTARA